MGAEVRTVTGVPIAANFGLGTGSPSSPIVINDATDIAYYVKNGVVTQLASSGVTSVTGTAPIASSGGATPAISLNNAGVTYAKIQNISATNTILGRKTAGAGSVEEITVAGDISQSGSTFTIAAGVVTYAKIQNISATNTILGRKTAGAGSAEEITVGGDISQSGSTFTIGAGVVTYAKIQNVSATSRFLGRITAGAGSTEELTAANAKTILGYTLASSDFVNQGTTTTVLHGNAAGNPSFGAVVLTTDVSGQLPLANGGTAANLTASNGGIFYSTGSAGAILAGTATAGQILRSGASTTPAWSTATYPATAGTSGNVLTSDGTNWTSAAASGGVTATGPSTWTPVDSSGASLSLTVTNAVYYQVGKLVTVLFDITYPATADATSAKIGGLPATAYNSTNDDFLGAPLPAFSNNVVPIVNHNATTFQLRDITAGALRTNANLATGTYRGSFSYFTA